MAGLEFACLPLLALLKLSLLVGCEVLAARSDNQYTVEMTDQNHFLPETVEVRLGRTVVWINRGYFEHTSTTEPALVQVAGDAVLPPGAEPWDSGTLNTGQIWERTCDVPGTCVYVCMLRELDGMIGSITITE